VIRIIGGPDNHDQLRACHGCGAWYHRTASSAPFCTEHCAGLYVSFERDRERKAARAERAAGPRLIVPGSPERNA